MSYQLSTSDLDPILLAIEERFKESKPRLFQVVSSWLLLAATLVHVLVYVLYVTGATQWIDKHLMDVAFSVIGLQALLLLAASTYLPVVKRQRRLYDELRLISTDPTPGLVWKQWTPNRRVLVRGAVGGVLAGVLGALAWNYRELDIPKELPPLLGTLALICVTAFWVWSDRKIPLRTVERMLFWIQLGFVGWLVAYFALSFLDLDYDWITLLLYALWPAWLLAKSRQVARIQERFAPLARAKGIRDSLRQNREEARNSGSDIVSLDADDVARLAYAEREIIQQDRVEAIGRAKRESADRWAVLTPDSVHSQLRELVPEERLKVADAISALSATGAAQSSAASDPVLSLEVAGTSVGLRYRLDSKARRVTVVELVSLGAPSDG